LFIILPHGLNHFAEFAFDIFFVFVYYLSLLDVNSWLPPFCFIGQAFAAILPEVARFLAIEASTLLLFFFGWFYRINIHAVFRANMVPLFVEEFEKVGFQLR
jgi:hypothetical protein